MNRRTLAALIATSLAATAAVGISGCATVPEVEASGDVRALVLALQTRDLAGIEARIDRPALRAQLTGIGRRLVADGVQDALGNRQGAALVGLLAADAGDRVIAGIVDRALEPAVLADLAAEAGLTATRPVPGRTATALSLRRLDQGRVCAPEGGRDGARCLMVFTRSDRGWRLSALDEATLLRRLGIRQPG